MAAPLTRIFSRSSKFITANSFKAWDSNVHRQPHVINTLSRNILTTPTAKKYTSNSKLLLITGGCTLFVGTVFGVVNKTEAKEPTESRPIYTPSKEIRTATDKSGLKLTLYQYATCPFCCKIRAFLDYYGYNYDIVEVNSVWKTQLKWSKYPKVPVLCADGVGPEGFVQMNDSSVIMSILSSNTVDQSVGLEKLTSYYPFTVKKERGRTTYQFDNKYHIMYGDVECGRTKKELKEEIKWRKWTDDVMVHMISPNCYRSPSEALQAFRYFSDAGEWEKHFTTFERYTIIYAGAAVMYVLGKFLKKKYKLDEDVRVSLYDSCNQWIDAIGDKRQFMGGDQPNLADISVYGVLCSMEGCHAFQDALVNSKIGDWFYRTKAAVKEHKGAAALSGLGQDRS